MTFISAFVLTLIQSAFFYFVWTYFYNELLRMPYLMKGNFFVSFIYGVLYYVFMIVFDSSRIRENKASTTIFSQTLTIMTTNILVYFVIILPTYSRGFVYITPLFLTGIAQEFVMIVWTIIIYSIYKKLFPPMPMLLISDNKNLDTLEMKLRTRPDVINIKETIESNRPMNEIEDKCRRYSNVLVGDIESYSRNDILKFCFENSINTYILPKLSDILVKSSNDLFVFDSPIYVTSNEGIDFLDNVVKRIFDLLFSFIALVILLPFLIIIALLIKIEDGGKILFIQERVTKDYNHFKIYKFRSMKEDNKIGVNPTTKDDDRITKIGKFIRATHIDELPQLFNVLIGDMSVVGPRPERIEHVDYYSKEIKEFSYRLKVRAGLTGLAQIYGKYNTTAYDKLKLDLIYIKNYSLLFDLELILKTIKVLFIKENTEGFDNKQISKMNSYWEKNG